MLWMALHFPRLPLEVFAAGNPDPAQALVVLEDNRVFQQNLAAQACGISLGSTLATAHSIYPQLKHKHRAPNAELKQLHTLADTLYRFSAQVSLQAPDCVLLEIGGSLKLFGSYQRLVQEAQSLCRGLGYTTVGRVAQTPWAAIALARSQQQHLADVPLAEAGLELAGINAGAVERFANMGIYTLGPLLNLPNKALGRRFGKALLRYMAQLTGDLPDPRKSVTPAPDFSQTRHLLAPICDKDNLYQHPSSPMRHLAHTLQHWLITHQLGCERLCWQFLSHHHEQIDMPVQFAKGKQNAEDFMRISQLKLEQSELPAEVLTVRLSAQLTRPWAGSSHSLFKCMGDSEGEQPRSEIIDEFNARLGDGCCQSIQALPQHTPESSWRKMPVNRQANKQANKQSNKQSNKQFQASIKAQPVAGAENNYIQQLAKRPLWLFEPPRQVQLSELNLLQGPERIQSQWWRGETTCRDYYIAQHRLGAECWAFIDHKAQWYLHGYFG